MSKIATKRVSNYVDHEETLYWENGGITVYANRESGYATEDIDPKTGETEYNWHPDYYTLTSHEGMMPAFHTEELATIEELAKRMKDHADLRTWKIHHYED